VYIWQRETGQLLEALPGHGSGSVNCVAWNPREPSMFASCSDDHTIRLWEPHPAPSIEDPPVKGKQWHDTDPGGAIG
jgi:WD40 repeat protein